MKCPKCESNIVNDCCLRCGYMINGNKIKYNDDINDKFKEQKLFNKKFDEMYRNKKTYLGFILGPLYFSYRGHFILGTILVFLDYILFLKFGNFAGNFSLFPIIMLIYIILNRTVYASFSNTICLLVDNIRIKLIKKRYKENYLVKLEKYRHKKICLLFTIIFYIIVITLFTLIKRYQNGML